MYFLVSDIKMLIFSPKELSDVVYDLCLLNVRTIRVDMSVDAETRSETFVSFS